MKQKRLFAKAALFVLIVVSATFIGWELQLRGQGRGISYDDGGALWSNKRKQVYQPSDKATVFIGSSRIKYDLDIPTWKKITGDDPVQLANVGSSPRLILDDLAADKDFKGRLVIDVTEFLFFSPAPFVDETPTKNLDHYKKETPAQKFSYLVNRALEDNLIFIDKEEYSLNALLAGTRVSNRPGVYEFPDFPSGFTPVSADRQSYMTDALVNDSNQIKQVTSVWAMFGEMAKKMPPLTDSIIDGIMQSVKIACNKIKARGGQVIFVRTPSSGPLRAMEKMAFPREKFWNKLLAVTGCEGIHFEDYAPIANFVCPEFSHLSMAQAVDFTKGFIRILEEKGWKFSSRPNIIISSNAKK